MKIPYLNVEMCENFLVVCNAGVSCSVSPTDFVLHMGSNLGKWEV